MKKIILLTLLCTQSALADATLQSADFVKITSIDGQSINQGLLQKQQNQFALPAGKHTITARYDRLYHINRNNHDYLRSKDVVLEADFADNMHYTLRWHNMPTRYDEAKTYAKQPILLLTQNGQEQAKSDVQVHTNTTIGTMIGGVLGLNSDTDATIKALPVLDQFMQLWFIADEQERVKIREWLQQQP